MTGRSTNSVRVRSQPKGNQQRVEKLRALHFGRFYDENFGGLERHVALLLRGLAQRAMVWNLVANDCLRTETMQVNGYEVIKIPSLGLVASTPLCPTMPFVARRLYREHGVQIAHLHFPDPMSHLAASFLPQDVKLVISWHSDIVKQQRLLRLYRPFYASVINRADAIIAATPKHFETSTQLTLCKDRSKFRVVPYGLDYKPYLSAAAKHAGKLLKSKHGGAPLIFTVGRHVYYKGFEYLIDAMRLVRPDAKLMLGGQGPLTDALRKRARAAGVGDRVVLTGRIPESELPAYYYAADVFCMPSVDPSEAFGLVQLEAMACRKPVVGCDLKNGATYVNQNDVTGLVVPPRDAQALASALNRLLDDEVLRRRLGDAGYERATSEFSLERMWSGTLDVYRHILAS